MAIAVHLLGPPLLIRDEVVYATPRGRKVWALLAYLALSHGAPSRQQLIDLLFRTRKTLRARSAGTCRSSGGCWEVRTRSEAGTWSSSGSPRAP